MAGNSSAQDFKDSSSVGTGETHVFNTEDVLLSNERLERSSPVLWPDSATLFEGCNPITLSPGVQKCTKEGEARDMSKIVQELNQLTDHELRQKAQSLKNLSFQLSQEEAKEIARAKCLNIFEET